MVASSGRGVGPIPKTRAAGRDASEAPACLAGVSKQPVVSRGRGGLPAILRRRAELREISPSEDALGGFGITRFADFLQRR